MLFFLPAVPLVFMGQEWAASSQFLFFSDHEGELGERVRRGRREEFKTFAHEVALQISASADARWVSREDVPADLIESELEIYRAQAADKPENVRDKIAQGKLDKWLSTVCLLEQPYVRDSDRTVDDLRTEIAAKTGENVQIKRFTRYERGA